MQKSKALEAVAAIGQERSGAGELHQPNRAAGTGLHAKGHHPRLAMVAWVKAGMGTEGLTGLEQPIQPA